MHRLATLDDLQAVYALYMHEEVVPYLGHDPMPLAEFRAIMDELVASRSFYVVERDGQVRGFYRLSRHAGRARHGAYLGTFAVAPSERGTGLAASIIGDVVSRLRRDGVRRLELMLEADNPRALRFYEKQGFEFEGRLRNAYRRSDQDHDVDELLMARLL
ncbi:N-acetyltransferase [Hylemonella gracilis]|uniref:N-acetyltransferase n=1 Tax=Hylemonella gracilis TaxID=80880 RepID=A0A4P6UIT1_9BURK|nr:GNAT family N-acetyltransferase [Hylemonella gracilis]QBK05248.1 N-acetyltransferase [Hylemonella gracilis]